MIDRCVICKKKCCQGNNFHYVKRVLPGLINYGKTERVVFVDMCDDCFDNMLEELCNTNAFGQFLNMYLGNRNV